MHQYPPVRRDESVVEDYHGHKIADPYRWLEDPDSEETRQFVEAQNKLTYSVLEKCEARAKFNSRLTELFDYPKYGCPFKRGNRYFYFHNTGLQAQSVLYVQDSLDSEPRVLLDPNTLSTDGTVALGVYGFSEDGELFAYGCSSSGSDWQTIYLMNVSTGQKLPDVLKWVKFSGVSWTHDHKGFFYNRYPEPEKNADGTETDINLHQKVYYHYVGSDQSSDVLCFETPDNPKWMTGAEVTDDGKYLILSVSEGCDPVNRLYYADISDPSKGYSASSLNVVKLIDNFDALYSYITNNQKLFYFRTNLKAPRYKIIRIDFDQAEPSNWTTIIEEHEKDVLEWASCVNETKLVLCYLHDVKNVLQVHNLADGKFLANLPLDIGTIVGFSGRRQDQDIFYQFSGFLTPGTIFRCPLTTEELKPVVFREIKIKGFNPAEFQTEQVFYPSKDGELIPMFIVSKKNLPKDGNNPTFLYAYGGFNISISPSYSVSRLIFMQHFNGILAVANIRGGGEYGETWHKAGSLGQKQNCFNDFQCAAEYLIQNKYTQPSRLAINGGSNGGLLVGACVNQRPDLFGVAIAHVGVMDMLRFHKFTIGHAWTTDYGCSEKPEEFDWLIKYSPLHNVGKSSEGAAYPAVILFTGDHDDRVVPLHSFKLIATLQHEIGSRPNQTAPLLIRIDTKAGHGAGKPTKKVIEESSDMYALIGHFLNLKWAD